jgi:hypothetical protein
MPTRLVKRLDALQPRGALTVVDLTQIQHVPIDCAPRRHAPLLGNAPVPMLLAIFETPVALQVHGMQP